MEEPFSELVRPLMFSSAFSMPIQVSTEQQTPSAAAPHPANCDVCRANTVVRKMRAKMILVVEGIVIERYDEDEV